MLANALWKCNFFFNQIVISLFLLTVISRNDDCVISGTAVFFFNHMLEQHAWEIHLAGLYVNPESRKHIFF